MLSKQHYKAIAEIIRCVGSTYRGNYVYKWLAELFINYFTVDNPCFDRQKFLAACGL